MPATNDPPTGLNRRSLAAGRNSARHGETHAYCVIDTVQRLVAVDAAGALRVTVCAGIVVRHSD